MHTGVQGSSPLKMSGSKRVFIFRSRVAMVSLLTEGRYTVRESIYMDANEALASR